MSAIELSSRARNTLIRNHPDRDKAYEEWLDRWRQGRRARFDFSISDSDLVTWASTLSDHELLRFGNLGRKSLADIRALCEPWPGLVEVQ